MYEGESQSFGSYASAVSDSSALPVSDPKALRYTAAGTATKSVALTAGENLEEIAVRARNRTSAPSQVCLIVRINGVQQDSSKCLSTSQNTYQWINFTRDAAYTGDLHTVAVQSTDMHTNDQLFVDRVILNGTKEVACSPSIPTRISNASNGAIIDGGGCTERSHVIVNDKTITLRNVQIKGSDDWTGNFTSVLGSTGNFVSTNTVPALNEPQTTSDANNTDLCQSGTANGTQTCSEAEMVFFKGEYIKQRPDGTDPGPGEFALVSSTDRRVVLGFDPGTSKVEVTTRQRGLWLGNAASSGSTFDNVTVSQVGSTVGSSGSGAAVGNNGRNLTMTGSTVSTNHGVGMQCGGGASCNVTGSTFEHNGAAGFTSNDGNPTTFDNNIVRHSCSSTMVLSPDVDYNYSFNCSGIKLTGDIGQRTITNNELHHNMHAGLWLDLDPENTLIQFNRIHHNERQGIHLEVTFAPSTRPVTVRDNILYENGWVTTATGDPNSSDIYVNTSGGMKIFDNVMAWSRDGFSYIGNTRFPDESKLNNEFFSNEIIHCDYDTGTGFKHMLSFWNPGTNVLGSGTYNVGYDNRYYYCDRSTQTPTSIGTPKAEGGVGRYQWVPTGGVLANLSDFNATPGEENGTYMTQSTATSVLNAANVPLNSEH